MTEVAAPSPVAVPLPARRWRADDFIKGFLGSNALIAIVVLGLITIFLFREGFGFFGKNLANIRLYRPQQQRLCIARALAVEPEVVLMDEPCSALDPIATAKVEELIYQLRENFTIVIVTHNMQQAGRCSNYTAFFYLGRLIEFGATSKIFSNPSERKTEDYIAGRFG